MPSHTHEQDTQATVDSQESAHGVVSRMAAALIGAAVDLRDERACQRELLRLQHKFSYGDIVLFSDKARDQAILAKAMAR